MDYNEYIEEILGSIGNGLDGLLSGFTDKQYELFGARDFISVIREVLSGKFSLDVSDVFSFVLSLCGTSLSSLLALLVTVVSVSIAYSIIGSLKGGRCSDSVSGAVRFASTASVLAVVGVSSISMFTMCAKTLSSLANQINAIFPLILTLMAGTGGATTASVFSPSVAIITGGLFNLIINVVLPLLITAFVFGAVGNAVGDSSEFGKMSGFLRNAVKWMFGTGFFLLSAVLGVQGVTASVMDNIGIRSAKFTIGKYVPVIGGYMSDGFNLIVSGGIAVKNALGYTALVLLIITILPAIVQIAAFSLCLQLAAAVIEPLGNKQLSNMLYGMGKTVTLTGGIMFGAGFLYFILVLIVMSAGNVFL